MPLEKSFEDSLAGAATISVGSRAPPLGAPQGALPIGTLVADRFEVTGHIGQGGMGIVLSGRHVELGYSVAIKVLRAEWATDPEAVTRFKREALTAASLKSPHVARVFEAGKLADGRPFLVMEHLEGCDLGAHLAKYSRLPFDEAALWVLQACDAMAEAHARGIVHRDLKPENLFLAREGDRDLLKVVDFGISHIDLPSEVRVTQDNSAFGTPLYMSPEAVRSAKLTDARTDVWALGVILYELVAGAPPFNGESLAAVAVAVTVDPLLPLSERAPGVPPGADDLLAKALAKKPDDRFPSARELGQALRALVEVTSGVPPERDSRRGSMASFPSAVPAVTGDQAGLRATRPTRRRERALIAVAVAFAIGAITGIAWMLRPIPAAEPDAAIGLPPERQSEPAAMLTPQITPGAPGIADPAGSTSAPEPRTAPSGDRTGTAGPPRVTRSPGGIAAPTARPIEPTPPVPTPPPPAPKPTVKTPGGAPLHL